MRHVLCLLILAATFPVCVRATETSLLSSNAASASEQVRPVTLTTDQPSAPKVALVTFGPGRVYWERFGHNAIVVDDPAAGGRISYNYGVFDFQE